MPLQSGGTPSSVVVTIDKIDGAAVDGLTGTDHSLGYIAEEIEHHLHGYERWYGVALVPVGQTHVADRIGTAVAPLVIDAGNNAWGAWTQILGSDDTPADAGMTKWDFHRIFVNDTERTAWHFLQFAFGATGAGAYTAGEFTELVFEPASNQIEESPIEVWTKRQDAGTKAWARAFIPGLDTGTVTFFLGLHEYEG